MHLEGKEEIWYKCFLYGKDDLANKGEFTRAICIRFDSREDVMGEFNKLVQDKYMEEYLENFEELKSFMNALNPLLLESYCIFSFIRGLKKDIKLMLKTLKPTILM